MACAPDTKGLENLQRHLHVCDLLAFSLQAERIQERVWQWRTWRSRDRRWSSTSPLATDRRKRSVASPVSRTMPVQQRHVMLEQMVTGHKS